MHEASDARLLREYAECGSETAFREIVARHADVVHSAALRQLGSPDAARDVAQCVFTDLARKAPSLVRTLSTEASLLGWLYRATRFAALNRLRDDRRRQARERLAMTCLDPAADPAPEWDRVQPVLDEAMAELSDADREALLLRFFKNHDFCAIGRSLGVSDDAAQKRVSRALEKLRAHLTRRGVTTTSAALAAALAANAVTAAPSGLAAALSTAALAETALATSTAAAATQSIAMTALQKTLAGAALAAAVGTGIYQARQAARLRAELATRQHERAPLLEQIDQLTRERDAATRALAGLRERDSLSNRDKLELLQLRGEVTRLRQQARELTALPSALPDGGQDATASAARSWLARVEQLRWHLTREPGAAIPEFALLAAEDWLDVAKEPLETHEDYRKAMSRLRRAAEEKAGRLLQAAFTEFMEANNAQPPSDLTQLRPFLKEPLDEATLKRWEVVPRERLFGAVASDDWVITPRSPVDKDYDARPYFSSDGSHGMTLFSAQNSN